MTNLNDYNLWKLSTLIKSDRTILYEIVLSLGGDNFLIETVQQDLKELYGNQISDNDYCRICFFKILINLRNKKGEDFLNIVKNVFTELGFTHEYLLKS